MHDFLHELLVAAIAFVLFVSPCVVASRISADRYPRRRRRSNVPYDGVERRSTR